MAYRSSSVRASADTDSSSISIPVPSGAAIGDIALVGIGQWNTGGAEAITGVPAGFALITSLQAIPVKTSMYWKRLTAADTGNYTFTKAAGSGWWNGACILLTGRLASGDPITTFFASGSNGFGSALPAATVSSISYIPDLVYYAYHENGATGGTPHTNYTRAQSPEYGKLDYRIKGTTGTEAASGGTLGASMWATGILVAVAPAAGGGATPVGKDLSLVWNTRTAVGKDVALAWNTRALVGDDLALAWDTRVAVGDDLQLLWDTRVPVGDDLDLRWDTRAVSSKDLALAWDLYTPVGKDLEVVWEVETEEPTTAVGKDLELVWDTHAAVGKDLSLSWDTRAVVGDNLELLWDTRVAVGEDLAISWDTRTLAGRDLDLLWNLYTPVGDDLELLWNLQTPVGKDLILRWAVESNALPVDISVLIGQTEVDHRVQLSSTEMLDRFTVGATLEWLQVGDTFIGVDVKATEALWAIGDTEV